MKFLYTNDWHLTERRPCNRIDEDFFEMQFLKVKEIFGIAKEHKVDKIIHGADWFDSPRIDLGILNELIRILKDYSIPVETVIGNHDIQGYNLLSIRRSALGTLLRSGLVKLIKSYGIHTSVTHTLEMYKAIPFEEEVIVTHHLVTPDAVPFDHILCKDLAPHVTNKIVLCGHKHRSFYYESYEDNCIMLNTGCLVRHSIAEKDHVPYVVVGQTNPFQIQNILITSARKGDEVFDLTLKETQKKMDLDIEAFVQELKSTKFSQRDLKSVFSDFVKDKNIEPQILEEAYKRIGVIG